MSQRPADLTIHEESLERFQNDDGFGLKRAIEFGLQWLPDALEVTDVRISAPAWMNRRWAAIATISLASAGATHDIRITVPWLLNDQAATSASTYGIKDRVGAFRGTYWMGRFRQPLVSYMWRPGVHRITFPVEDGNTYRGLVVGEFGTYWQLRHHRENGRDQIVIRNRYSRLSPDDRAVFDAASLLDQTSPTELHELHEGLTDSRRFVSGEAPTDDQIRDLVEWLISIEKTDRGTLDAPGRLKRGDPLHSDDPMAVPMQERHWQPAGLGDLLASAIAHAVSAVVRRGSLASDTDAEQLVARIRTAAAGAVDSVVRGLDDFSDSVVGERPINTLARLEASRQRTFIGFGGLETYQGRLDLRVLPSPWRNKLCPLQTQESSNIGLIRHSALADWNGADPNQVTSSYSDLSVAAALIPFIGHDDPTRAALGCKMLKQAVILDRPEAPLIRTGIEALVGEVGSTRATVSGSCDGVDTALGLALVGEVDLPVGAQSTWPDLPGDRWTASKVSGMISAGDLLAHAPDIMIEEEQPVLAFGLNATVAFLAWHGFNYEDGVVVSESFAKRMSSTHTVRLATAYDPMLGVVELLSATNAYELVPAHTPILKVRGDTDRVLAMPEDGYLVRVSDTAGRYYSTRSKPGDYQQEVRVAYRVTRPLQIGDKLTTRHGGKGVVTRIEPDEQMPRLPDGRIVEVLLNPLGVFGRLNMGTLMELAAGLELVLSQGWESARPRIVPRHLGREARLALAKQLELRCAGKGKLPLADATGKRVGPPEGVMVGPLYIVKLDHLAKHKGGSRDDAAPSPVTFQPVKASAWRGDRRRSAPQRLGEMELWSLEAVQATKTLDDLMAVRGVGEPALREERGLLPAGLRAGLAHLAVAGVSFISGETAREITLDPTVGAPNEVVRALWRGGENGSGLEDVIETFADRAREGLAADTRKSRKGEGRASAGHLAVAGQILELALREPAPKETQPDRGTGETVRYEIVLPAPVDHPWNVPVPGSKGYRVLPPLQRLAILPPSAFAGTPSPDRDPLRRTYREIIRWALIHSEAADVRSRASALKHIDREVRAFLGSIRKVGGDAETISGRTTGKFGLLRRNGLGAAAIRSGRAVLVCDPELDPEHARIPRWMAEDLGVSGERTRGDYSDVVIVNRQPTLHPYNIQALRAEIWDESAVALHPLLLQSIAGDFDGDTVAVHRLESEDARKEIWNLRRPAAALRSGATGALLAKLDLDVQLGLAFTRHGTASSVDLAEAAIKTLPTKTNTERADALSKIRILQREGLEAASSWGPSVIALDPPENESDLPTYLEMSAAEIYQGFATGAAGKLSGLGLQQRLIARGTATPPIIDLAAIDVRGNYLDGIADEDYFVAAQPAVTGIAAKKLLTPFAGTLTRNLVRHGYEIVITRGNCHGDGRSHSIFDCLDINGPCAAAYGDNLETGLPVQVGEPVGVRAALFIGEKSTQAALKSIHHRSGEDSGKAKLRELSAILLRNGQGRGDGFGGGGGAFTVPATFPELRGRTSKPLAYKDFMKRVKKTYFPELDEDDHPTHDVIKKVQEILVARCREILSQVDDKVVVDDKHAAVLIRQRFLYDSMAARPAGAEQIAPPRSGLLPTSVWTGQLKALVLQLGVPAVWDDAKTRLVAEPSGAVAIEHPGAEDHVAASERLTATLRNAHSVVTNG